MKGQNIKKCQQKELNLMGKTDKKTRNYIFFSATRQKAEKKGKKGVKLNFGLQRTKQSRIQQNFHSFSITDSI